jgi:hypothetical protein
MKSAICGFLKPDQAAMVQIIGESRANQGGMFIAKGEKQCGMIEPSKIP